MKNLLFSVCLIFVVSLTGCKKKGNDCTAGLGGGLTIVASTYHHSKPIPGCTVYIKFNATDFPGADVSVYEKSYKIPNDSIQVTIPGLQCGDYYFYAVGYDSSLTAIQNPVVGGVPYSTDKKDGKILLTVPVTEGD